MTQVLPLKVTATSKIFFPEALGWAVPEELQPLSAGIEMTPVDEMVKEIYPLPAPVAACP